MMQWCFLPTTKRQSMAKRKKRKPKENALDESFRRLDGTLDKIAFMNYLARFSRMMNDPDYVAQWASNQQ